MGKNDIVIYKAKNLQIVYNYLFVIILMEIVSILVSRNIKSALYCLTITCFFCIIHALCSKFLVSIKFVEDSSEISLHIREFIFSKNNFLLESEKICFSFKDEITGRGVKSQVFTLYNSDKRKIIKLSSSSSGFSQYEIEEIVSECRNMDIKEVV